MVVTGDFLAGMDAVGPVLAALEPLLERPGAFVPGNNDYFEPKLKNPMRYVTGREEPPNLPRGTAPRAAQEPGAQREATR